MTAPLCKDCAYVRLSQISRKITEEVCGIERHPHLSIEDQRAPEGPCGPGGKLFAKRQGVG